MNREFSRFLKTIRFVENCLVHRKLHGVYYLSQVQYVIQSFRRIRQLVWPVCGLTGSSPVLRTLISAYGNHCSAVYIFWTHTWTHVILCIILDGLPKIIVVTKLYLKLVFHYLTNNIYQLFFTLHPNNYD